MNNTFKKIYKQDVLVNTMNGIVSSIPVIGGALSGLISEFLPNKKQERLIEFIEGFANRLNDLEEKINKDYIQTESFGYILETSLVLVSKNYHQTKVKFIKNALVNSLIQDISWDNKELYLELIGQLSDLQLNIILLLFDPIEYIKIRNIEGSTISNMGFGNVMGHIFNTVDKNILQNQYGELYNLGIVNTDKNIFNTMTAGSGINIISGRLSQLGKDLIDFAKE